jgi:hypothetical protein
MPALTAVQIMSNLACLVANAGYCWPCRAASCCPLGTGVLTASCDTLDRMPKQPDCKWAQRPDKIMLTLNVANVDPAKADIKVQMRK